MNIKAINLDFYGTLVDWLTIWINTAEDIVDSNNLGITPKEFALEWRKIQRKFLDKQEFVYYKENILLALIELCKKYNIKNNNYHEILFNKWKNINPFFEVSEVLQRLKTKYKIGICTNSSRDLFDISVKRIPIIFDYVLISDETKVNKPHFSMYQKAIDFLGFPPQNIFHVASSQMDVKGAANAGLVVCWINRNKEERFPETPKPAFEINKLDELLNIL